MKIILNPPTALFVLLISLMTLSFSSFSMDGDKPGPKKLGSKNLLQPKIQALDLALPFANPLELQAVGKLKGNKNLWQTAFDDSFLGLKTLEEIAKPKTFTTSLLPKAPKSLNPTPQEIRKLEIKALRKRKSAKKELNYREKQFHKDAKKKPSYKSIDTAYNKPTKKAVRLQAKSDAFKTLPQSSFKSLREVPQFLKKDIASQQAQLNGNKYVTSNHEKKLKKQHEITQKKYIQELNKQRAQPTTIDIESTQPEVFKKNKHSSQLTNAKGRLHIEDLIKRIGRKNILKAENNFLKYYIKLKNKFSALQRQHQHNPQNSQLLECFEETRQADLKLKKILIFDPLQILQPKEPRKVKIEGKVKFPTNELIKNALYEENQFLKKYVELKEELTNLKKLHKPEPNNPRLLKHQQEKKALELRLSHILENDNLKALLAPNSNNVHVLNTIEEVSQEFKINKQLLASQQEYLQNLETLKNTPYQATEFELEDAKENLKKLEVKRDILLREKSILGNHKTLHSSRTPRSLSCKIPDDSFTGVLESQSPSKNLEVLDLAPPQKQTFDIPTALEENQFLKQHMALQKKFDSLKETHAKTPQHPKLIQCAQELKESTTKLKRIFDGYSLETLQSRTLPLKFTPEGNPFEYSILEQENQFLRFYNYQRVTSQSLAPEATQINSANPVENNKVAQPSAPKNSKKTMACDIPGDTLTPEKLEKLEKSQRQKKEKKTKTRRKTSSQLPLKPQSQQANVLSLTQLELEAQQKLKAAEQAVMNIHQSLFEDNHPVAENASKKAATIEQQYKRLKQINNHQKSLQLPALGKGTTPTFASQSAYSSIKDLKIKRDIEVDKFFDAKQGRSKVAKFFPDQPKVLKAIEKKEMKAFKAGKKLEKQIYEQTKRLTQDNISKHIAPNSLPKPASDNFIPQRVANNNPPPLKPKISKTENVIQLPKKEIAKPERLHWQDPKTLTTPSDIKKQHSLPAKPSKPINKNNRVAQTNSTIATSQKATRVAQSKTSNKPSTQPQAHAAKPTAPGTSLVTTQPPLPPQQPLGKTALKLVSTYKPLAGAAILTETICKSDFGKNSSICKSLNLDEAAAQSKDVKNAHRDAFIQAATKIALDVGAFSIPVVGTAAGTTLLASSQAQSARQSIKSTDINKMCTPSADIFYQMYIGTTCKEYVEGLQVPLKAGEKLDAVVSKIAHFVADGIITGCNATGLTEENYKKAAEFVHNCIPKAPEFIQQSYQELLAVKKAYGSESNNRPSKTAAQNFRKENQAFLKALLDSSDPKLDQATRQKANAEYLKLTQADPTLEKRLDNFHQQVPLESKQKRAAQAHKKKVIADRNLSLSAEESAQKVAALLDDNFTSVNNKINELTEYIVQRDQQEFEYRQQEQQHEQFFNNINDGFTGAAALATIFGHHEAAYRIAALGGAAVQAASAISAFSAMGPMCGINPYVGTLSAIAGICSAFMDSGKDNSVDVILEAINNGIMHLSNQIEHFHKNMLVQFEHLHRTLNSHQRVILEKFFDLKADQKNMAQKLYELHRYIQENHTEIFGSIDSLHHKIDAQTHMISKEFQGIHSAEIDDLIQKALFTIDDDIPEAEFRATMIELFTKGITRASTDSLTGGAVDVASYDALQTALYDSAQRKNPFEHPAFPCINLLSRYLAYKLPGFKHEPQVNPLIWIKCTATTLDLLNSRLTDMHYPSTLRYKDSDLEKLHKLKQEGQKILDFIRMLHRNKYVQTVLADYQREAQSLAEAITLEKNKFEETETKKKLADYSAFVKKEKALMDALPQSYQCTQCIEETTKTIKAAHAIKANRGADLTQMLQSTLRPRPFIRLIDSFRGVQDASECRELYTIDEVDSLCYFRQGILPIFAAFQEEATRLNLEKLTTDLGKEEMTFSYGQKSLLMYPETNKKHLPTLIVPGPIYTLLSQEPYFRLAENEIGTIKHYYTIEQEKFFVRSYLVSMTGETKNKILIQELVKPYISDPLYTEHENVLHYWYEGRYPVSTTDIYKIDATHSGNRYTGYYPPATPYPSGYLTFATTATKTAIDLEPIKLQIWNTFKKRKQEERIRFNQIICNALASHATTSEVFKASQKFDVFYKLLESYLMLMYNTRFKSDENSTNFVKNNTAIEHYCTEYKKIDNQENDQGNYLPHHIKQATQKVVDTFSHMLNQDNIPQLKPVENLISSLDSLIKEYTKRPITKPKIKTEEYYRMARPLQQDFSNESADETMPISQERVLVSGLIESNQELTAEVSRLKKQLATNNSKLDLITDQMSVMVSLVMQMKNNQMHTTSTPASLPPTEILEAHTLFWPYSQPTSVKKVATQKAAECGYHALFNALRCFSSRLSLPSFLRTSKAHIERQNSSFRDQWLSEDQMADLLERNKTEAMNITLIPDISLYEEGSHSLEHSVLEGLAQSQAALKNGLESYKHVFILGTMNSKNNNIMSHWVAVEQTIQNGKATYSIMNSLPSYPHDKQVVILQNMLHNNNQQYDFNVFSPEVEHELSGYISQIHLATIFERQEYARTGESSRASTYRIVDETIVQIVDNILSAAEKLLELTHGNSFWSTEGSVEPKNLIYEALIQIKECEGQEVICKDKKSDENGKPTTLQITPEQKKRIAQLEILLEI